MNRFFCTILLFLLFFPVYAQQESTDTLLLEQRVEKLENRVGKWDKFNISGYIQAEFQHAQKQATSEWVKVGSTINENPEHSFNRIGIRRGRIKLAYTEKILSGVFQLDLTENGISFKDVYLSVYDPWIQTFALKAGVFDRPFGYEVAYSSSRRESPERSQVFQTLFPQERDLGLMLTLQAPKTSAWSILKLEGGLFAGNGIKKETDSRKDFIGHLSFDKNISPLHIAGGVSYYYGGVYNPTNTVYVLNDKIFVDKEIRRGQYLKREYFGIDARISLASVLGTTTLRGEFLWGSQPGTQTDSKSPNYNSLPTDDISNSLYERNFYGYYLHLVQSVFQTPVSLTVKYDVYDPNCKLSGNEIGKGESNTGKADLAVQTLGVGAIWNINKNLLLMGYYEFVYNEKTAHVSGYETNRKDNVFTCRLQYKY